MTQTNEDKLRQYTPEKVNVSTGGTTQKEFEDIDKDYLLILADAFLQCAQYAKAMTIFDLLLDIFPQDLQALKCKAFVYMMQEHYQEALDLIMQLKQNKIDEISYAILSLISARVLLKLGREEEARSAMQDFIELKKIHKISGLT